MSFLSYYSLLSPLLPPHPTPPGAQTNASNFFHNRTLFKGDNRDDWAAPAAHYELAVLAWKESCDPQCWPTATKEVEAYRRAKVAECEKYLDQVRNWEAFVLDARVGMKVQTGLDTIAWFKGKKGWAS